MVGLRLRPAFVGNVHKVCQVTRPGALVIGFLRDYRHEIALNPFCVGCPIGDLEPTEGEACMRAIDRIHHPATDLRALKVTRIAGEKFGAVYDLHDAVATRAVRKVDAITCGAGGDGTMDGRYGGEAVWKRNAHILLPVKRPIPDEFGVRRVAQVEDHDVVAWPPLRIVGCASTDNVSNPAVTFPPVLVGPR